jgi:hypothetical protein
MTQSIHLQKARNLCAEHRMFGSPTRGEHLGAKQTGTILWDRDGWPFVEAKLAAAFEALEAAIRSELQHVNKPQSQEAGN